MDTRTPIPVPDEPRLAPRAPSRAHERGDAWLAAAVAFAATSMVLLVVAVGAG